MPLRVLIVSLISLWTLNAQAGRLGPSSSGGGVGIACLEKGEEKVYLADTFDFVRRFGTRRMDAKYFEIANAIPSSERHPEIVVQAAVTLVSKIRPQKEFAHPWQANERVDLAWMIFHTWANLGFKSESNLTPVDDDHIEPKDLPAGCRKVQLAVQQVGRNLVGENSNLVARLSPIEHGFYQLHETLIALRNSPGEDTTPIRKAVADLLDNKRFSFFQILNQLPKKKMSSPIGEDWNEAKRWWACKTVVPEYLGIGIEDIPNCTPPGKITGRQPEIDQRGLPIFERFPAKLTCRIVAELQDGYGWSLGKEFAIERVSGDGLSGHSVYALTFKTHAGFVQYEGKTTFFRQTLGTYGEMATVIGTDRRVIGPVYAGPIVNLNRFHRRTQEFTGRLTNSVAFDPIPEAYEFKLSCVAEKNDFGLNLGPENPF